MKQVLLILILGLLGFSGYSQKKKDLLNEIIKLKSEIKKDREKIAKVESINKTTLSKLDFSNNQIEELKNENAALLKTINNFTSVSIQKTENVENSLKTIKEKDDQLKVVKDALTKAEASRLSELQTFKNKLSTIGKIGIQNNQLVMGIPNTDLFVAADTTFMLSIKGKNNLLKIAEVLTENPTYTINIESSNNLFTSKNDTINNYWDVNARQAASIASNLEKDCKIDAKRLAIINKGKSIDTINTKAITRIIIDPNFDDFFSLIKERMKN